MPKNITWMGVFYVQRNERTTKHNISLTQKGKAIPLQALTDPEDSRRLRLPDFKTVGT
jgi:hypothetical protein